MSLKTHQNYAYATITTFDKEEVYLTQEEFEVFEKILNNPNIKFLTFDDGAIALSDIRRYELIHKPQREDRQLERPDYSDYVTEPRELTPEEQEESRKAEEERQKRVRENTERFKKEAEMRHHTILPEVPQRELEEAEKELEELRKRKLQQSS